MSNQVANDPSAAFRQNLAEFEQMLMQAKKVPLSNMCMMDRERTIQIANGLHDDLPEVVTACKAIVDKEATTIAQANDRAEQIKQNATMHANQFVGSAKTQAKQMVQQAQQQAQEMINQAQQQAQEMVNQAQKQAAGMIQDAETRSRQLISEQEITARANLEAEELRRGTQEEIEKLYHDVYSHIDDVLAQLDRSISEKLTDIRMTRQQIDQSISMR